MLHCRNGRILHPLGSHRVASTVRRPLHPSCGDQVFNSTQGDLQVTHSSVVFLLACSGLHKRAGMWCPLHLATSSWESV
jgi:hypothetical protein